MKTFMDGLAHATIQIQMPDNSGSTAKLDLLAELSVNAGCIETHSQEQPWASTIQSRACLGR